MEQDSESNLDYYNRIAAGIDLTIVLAEIFDLFDERNDLEEMHNAVSMLTNLDSSNHGNGVRNAIVRRVRDYRDSKK